MAQTVKLKDIADRAGVSVAAVSAALNGTGTVSAAMRERVRKVAQEMNYEPNFAAKLLKQKQNNDLGLIVSDIPERIFGSGYFMPMISCFIRQCEELGLRCQIEYYDLTKAEKLPALLTNGLAGGVLLLMAVVVALSFGRDAHGWTWASGALLEDLMPWRWPRIMAALFAAVLCML